MTEKKELKVKENVLKQIRARMTALEGGKVLLQAARRELNLYVLDELSKLGLDVKNKNFRVDENTGAVKEVKEETVALEEKEEVKVESAND